MTHWNQYRYLSRQLLYLLLFCCWFGYALTDLEYYEFESIFFPSTIQFRIEGRPNTPTVFSRDVVYRDSLIRTCKLYQFSDSDCNSLWGQVKNTIFNPEGKVFVRDYQLDLEHSPEVLMAEHSNFQTICMEGTDCLLNKENEYVIARKILSPYSAEDIIAMQRVVFIHSCLVPGVGANILEELLDNITESGLMDQAGAVFVLNYGESLPDDTVARYSKAVFLQASSDIARFEIPTLQTVHYFSKLSHALRTRSGLPVPGSPNDYQIMYIHTKGVSVLEEVEQIRDWRRYMSFFVIKNHVKCGVLLSSDVCDAVGVNLLKSRRYSWQDEDEQNWHFSGNFWWAKMDYLANLPFLSIGRNGKYDAELWIGSAGYTRMLTMHDSWISHYEETYHPENYESSPFLSELDALVEANH